MTPKTAYIWGGYFLIIQTFILFFNLRIGNPDVLLWYCNHAPGIIAVGFFLRRLKVIKALVIVGILPQLFWFIDLLSLFVIDESWFGFSEYLLERNVWGFLLALLIHIFTTFIALLIVIKERVDLRTLTYSFSYLVLLWGSTLILSPADININCVYGICGMETFSLPFYTSLWVFYTLFFMILPVALILDGLAKTYDKNGEKLRDRFWDKPLLPK